MNELLLDTNVLIYAIDENSLFHDRARSLVCSSEHSLFTTSKNISELLAVLTRNTDIGLEAMQAVAAAEYYCKNLVILYPDSQSYDTFLQLLKTHKPKGLKVHDFEIASIGLSYGINTIATANVRDFKQIDGLNILPL